MGSGLSRRAGAARRSSPSGASRLHGSPRDGAHSGVLPGRHTGTQRTGATEPGGGGHDAVDGPGGLYPPEDKRAVATRLADLPPLRTAGHAVGDFNIVLDGPRDAVDMEVAPALRTALEQWGLLRMDVPDTHYAGGRGAAIDVAAVCRAW
eukprot:15430279-Alexandrium_andersonii.AAC.1